MCGICGQHILAGNEAVDRDIISTMMDSLKHRGPDDSGQYLNGGIGLGFRRLSIIDLDGGHQPMCNETQQVWTVFNGEIYNYRELRETLEKGGHRFRSQSDTEVIVHGYEEWGADFLTRLNGMFGLAVWDERQRMLLLARDRFGIKPLYYALSRGSCLFGSEMRAVAHGIGAPLTVDRTGLRLFLQMRYTPSPLTMVSGISKLAAGTCLVARGGRVELSRWSRSRPEPLRPVPSIQEAREQLAFLYGRAVRRQLVSDVPLGILLSGGVDSGLLLALMKSDKRTWPSYTVGFAGSFAKDEVDLAAATAAAFGSQHASVRITEDEFAQSLNDVVYHLEEPVTASSVVPMYHLCKLARQNVKVAFMGQGPDEIFAGYARHLGIQYGRYWRSLPAFLRTAVSATAEALTRAEWVRRSAKPLAVAERTERYRQVFSLLPDGVVDELLGDLQLTESARGFWWKLNEELSGQMPSGELRGLQFLELSYSLPDELLTYGDKLSMAHGLEVRVPYLDQDVVDFVQGLPTSYLIHFGKGKWLHKSVAASLLPATIVSRRKLGFDTPVDQWFAHSLRSGLTRVLLDRAAPLFDQVSFVAVSRILREHQQGARDHSKLLFSLIALDQWMKIFL